MLSQQNREETKKTAQEDAQNLNEASNFSPENPKPKDNKEKNNSDQHNSISIVSENLGLDNIIENRGKVTQTSTFNKD